MQPRKAHILSGKRQSAGDEGVKVIALKHADTEKGMLFDTTVMSAVKTQSLALPFEMFLSLADLS